MREDKTNELIFLLSLILQLCPNNCSFLCITSWTRSVFLLQFLYKVPHLLPCVIALFDVVNCMHEIVFITARRSYVSAVLGVAILSVRLSVCPSVTRILCDKNQTTHWGYFDTTRKTRKGNHSSFLTTTVVDGRRSLSSET